MFVLNVAIFLHIQLCIKSTWNKCITLINLFREPQILKLQLKDVYASVGQRPAESAVQ